MAYADYAYYTDEYFGTAITETAFPRLAMRASHWLDRLTFNRAADDVDNEDAIKNAMCAIAEDIQASEQSNGEIQSETIGQNSVTYVASASLSDGQTYLQSASLYLGNTGLLFGGFLDGEYSGEVDAD